MMRALWSSATGMEAQQLKIDVISNNLANVNTPGYKRSRVDFQDLLYQTQKAPGSLTAAGTAGPGGVQVGLGVRTGGLQKIHTEGDFQQTQNNLDIAVEGDGFFQVLLPNGELAYSRAGNFRLNSEGTVVTPDGYVLQPEISIPAEATDITIAPDGTVSVTQTGEATSEEVGQIQVARFANPAGLRAMGRNVHLESGASGTPELGTPGENGLGTLAEGFLEMSNVNLVEEMVNMISAQRAYETSSRVISTADEMLQAATRVIG